MIGLMILTAAAQAPAQLASNDEARWRMFIRASLQSPPAAEPDRSRIRELEGIVRRLRDDRDRLRIAGPSGL
ncbi:MAG: hypothetical protein JOZ90_09185 [Alphaproteobacteria bacterium]|nr:hypothetical protein [Alphaproteobacteria bacterium]MBV9373294.1 hypothetical protein [Alphaproteobacteria bacterium]MBV9901257.1 hypothetical protein [Alphaproteobacteria bacterium]